MHFYFDILKEIPPDSIFWEENTKFISPQIDPLYFYENKISTFFFLISQANLWQM